MNKHIKKILTDSGFTVDKNTKTITATVCRR